MSRRGPILLIFYFLFNTHALLSQELDTRMYTSLDGLSANSIFYFHEDHFGYLWMATELGLNRFDGTNFKKYGVRNGMPSLICNHIYADHNGKMWVGTRRGIAEFRKDSFYVYENTDHVQITYVFQIYENPQRQLIANTEQGQYKFNGNQWEPYSGLSGLNKEVIVWSIVTKEGEYFNTAFELFFKNKSGSVKSIWNHHSNAAFFRGLQYLDNELYVMTDSALYKIDSIHKEQMFTDYLKDKGLLTYFKDSRGRWWFSTKQDGILMLEEKAGHISYYNIPANYNFMAFFFEDRENQIWISSPGGVMKVLPSAFSQMKIREVKKGQHIRNLIPYGDRQFLVSISDGRLLIIQYDTDFASTYHVTASYDLDMKGDFIDQYSIGPEGEMWLTTRERQLYLIEDEKLENKTYLVKSVGQLYSYDIACDKVSGRIIVGMDSLLGIGDRFRLDTFFDDRRSIIRFPRRLLIMEKNNLIIQSSPGEVFLYPLHNDTKTRLFTRQMAASGNRSIALDELEHLWIATKGLNVSSFTSGNPPELILDKIIKEASDNINTVFFFFTIDHEGSIWSVTNHGIQQIYKGQNMQWQSREYINYEISHAVYPDWFKVVEYGNKIWVNLQNQLISFDIKKPERAEQSGNVIIEDVQLQNQSTDWKNFTDSLTTYFAIPSNLQLRYNQNTITFNYNCPTTLEAPGTMYSYRLLPADTAWSKSSENKSVSFSELKPADYSFQVRSRNTGMSWSNPTLFSFSIQRPFWEETWFRILILVLTSGLVAWIFRIRLRQERAKGEIKGQLLELEMRALRAQMNPHFIYNALNSIQSLVATDQTASANKYISKFARLLRQVLENSKRSEIPLSKELESLRLYVDLEKLRLDEDVQFLEKSDESIVPENICVPPLILQPFVENALWHGLSTKEGDKIIELAITADQEWVHFIITDNGIGRQQAAKLKSPLTQHESTALQITEQRLRDFNGALNANPLQIEDLFSPDGTSSGTRIRLLIRKKPYAGAPAQ